MCRFLVLDDDEDARYLVTANLEALGHEVAATADFGEARRYLAEGDVDVLILDISMPEGDGAEFLSLVRADGTEPRHVFLLSALPPKVISEMAEDLGVGGISKPFTGATLRESLAPVLV